MTTPPASSAQPALTACAGPLPSCSATVRTYTAETALQLWRLKRAVVFIEAHLGEQVTLLDLATYTGLSPMHFASQFRAATGVRPHEYVMRRKIEEAQLLLLISRRTLIDIATSFGFLTQSHFTTVFKRFVGLPPLRWQQNRLRQVASATLRLERLEKRRRSPLSTPVKKPFGLRPDMSAAFASAGLASSGPGKL